MEPGHRVVDSYRLTLVLADIAPSVSRGLNCSLVALGSGLNQNQLAQIVQQSAHKGVIRIEPSGSERREFLSSNRHRQTVTIERFIIELVAGVLTGRHYKALAGQHFGLDNIE